MTAALAIRGLNAWYGESQVLHGVDFEIDEGEVITLVGRNGAGRTTTLRSILGLVTRRSGSIRIRGRETAAMPPHVIARAGIGYCPEERGIFSTLTAEENLLLLPRVGSAPMDLQDVYEMFPNLCERRASYGTRLSGGEQQMLAIARILRAGAKILLLDEITEGLAPVIVQKLADVIRRLRDRGYTIVLVEQNFQFAAALADRHHIIEGGRVIATATRAELTLDRTLFERHLAI